LRVAVKRRNQLRLLQLRRLGGQDQGLRVVVHRVGLGRYHRLRVVRRPREVQEELRLKKCPRRKKMRA
jgi:hypothetical protein